MQNKKEDKYFVYMLRCKDDSIYTGLTKDIERRMEEHFTKDKKAAKYVKKVGAKKLETYFETDSRKKAAKLEYHIKRLNKKQKEELILNKNLEIFEGRIDKKEYK